MDALSRNFNRTIILIAKTLSLASTQMEENIALLATLLHLTIYVTLIDGRLFDNTFSIRKNVLVFTPQAAGILAVVTAIGNRNIHVRNFAAAI